MQSMQTNTNPPIVIPIHAIGRPEWLCLRILFKEMIPNIKASKPTNTLKGKQINPVKGMGDKPPQKKRMVRIPNTRLRMECLFVGE